jgi:hypothetical protein
MGLPRFTHLTDCAFKSNLPTICVFYLIYQHLTVVDQTCNYNRKGSGANGYGLSNGWTVMNAANNAANPLTGVRMGTRSDQGQSPIIPPP